MGIVPAKKNKIILSKPVRSAKNMDYLIDIKTAINLLSKKRKIFVSEADFQLELAWILKDMNPTAKVLCEYTPDFDPNMHIDILVINDGKWIPIELKYKTKGCEKIVDDIKYILKNHSAKDVNCYLYLNDIMRIEKIKTQKPDFFAEGYTIFITNELSYTKSPQKSNCVYKDFSLETDSIKQGVLQWAEHTGNGTKHGREEPIKLSGVYKCEWNTFSVIDDTNTGHFKYLLNIIK